MPVNAKPYSSWWVIHGVSRTVHYYSIAKHLHGYISFKAVDNLTPSVNEPATTWEMSFVAFVHSYVMVYYSPVVEALHGEEEVVHWETNSEVVVTAL